MDHAENVNNCLRVSSGDNREIRDNRERIRSISFYFENRGEGSIEKSVQKNRHGAVVNCLRYVHPVYDQRKCFLNQTEFYALIERLYRQFGFEKWRDKYYKASLDGFHWVIQVMFTDGKTQERSGSNACPPHWESVWKMFWDLIPREYQGIRKKERKV